MGFQWVPQLLVKINSVVIPASLFFDSGDTCCNEPGKDSLHRPFGDAHLISDLPCSWLWFVCQADEHMCIVAEKGPGLRFCDHL